ncbi:hypothetical protein CABS03_04708 [Colletotrichum abscissum]|uniref:Uncharacterized protein n=1 Tax=Colletotrichum abscissum TaxID=1671311 RepID=A0A9P9XCG0_9PEZI|nr:hypothetical protein CABS02_07902 [Colletotrichum abscissum]
MQTPGIRHSVAFMPASGAAISAGGECDRVLLHVPPIYNGQPLPEFAIPIIRVKWGMSRSTQFGGD